MSTIGVGALERGDRRTPQRKTVVLLAQALSLTAEQRQVFEAAAARRTVTRPLENRATGSPVDPGLRGSQKLPLALKSLIGREAEIAEIVALLEQSQLVTLTGAGGVGKTSAALKAGNILLERTKQTVCFVELAPLRDGSFVAATIAEALEIEKWPHLPLLETLLAYLEKETLVLILDNCEHVVEQAAQVAEAILRRCSTVRILGTSREPLRIAGERSYRLPSLAFPTAETTRALGADDAARYGAIALFIERAQAVDHRFLLTDDNASTVAEICRRLDGIPLAIELAAARVTLLPVRVLLRKLDGRFSVLSGGERNALPRHQTMRALIDWSYNLLSQSEQWLFESLSIFAGGCTLYAAAAVYEACVPPAGGEDGARVLQLLASLVDKSLVTADVGAREPRYRLSESAREYGRERLVKRGAEAVVAQRHALACLERAEQLERAYDREPFQVWCEKAQAEMENWRTALEWALGRRGDVVGGQRLVGALIYVWNEFALAEGSRFADLALQLADPQTPLSVLAKLQLTESYIALNLCAHAAALASAERAGVTYEALGEPVGVAWAQYLAGMPLLLLGRSVQAELLLQQALATARTRGERRLSAGILCHIAYARARDGDFDGGRIAYGEARAMFEAFGADGRVARTLADLAELEFRAGDAETALRHATDAFATLRERNGGIDVTTLINMSAYLVSLDRYDEARARAREALAAGREQQRHAVVAFALQHLAAVAALRPQATLTRTLEARVRAARIVGFVEARLTALAHVPRAYTERQEYDRIILMLCDALGADALVELMAEGAAMTEGQAIDEALRT